MPDTEIDIIFPDPIITDVVIDKLGPAGVGVPAGGTTGQRLAKTSNTSFDTQWVDPAVGATNWGDILGTLSNQVDLQNALNAKDAVLTFSDSVSRSVNTITLKNDSAAPGASKYYGTDGTSTFGYFALPSGASPANPTATVSGSAVNGAAATFMRSDAAPALANTAVTAGSYGDASHVPGYTVDAQGRLTAASNTAISITASAAGLGNVTNDTQTKAAIVPNTAPAAGQILAGNAGGTAYAPVTLSGSGATATLSSAGVLTLSAIPNATLSNSSITIAGHSVSLGGTQTLASTDLSDTANIDLLNAAQAMSALKTFNAGVTVSGSALTLSGNQSSAAWTTSGLRIKGVSGTLTDTTSSGTVAAAYTDKLGGNTIAATNATTFTEYASLKLSAPVQGTNVTITNAYALDADSATIGTSTPVTISSAGALTATSPALTTPKVTTGINDANGNSMLAFTATGSAVDGFTFTNAATANPAVVSIAGTGSDSNITISLVPKGSGMVRVPVGTSTALGLQFGTTVTGFYNRSNTIDMQLNGTAFAEFQASADQGITINSAYPITWSTNVTGTAPDLGIFRNAAGVLEINNKNAGTFRDLKLRKEMGVQTAAGTVTNTYSLDVTVGRSWTMTTTASTNLTITPTAAGTADQTITLIITSDATGGDVVTFASPFKPSGTMTLTASKIHTIRFISDGTNLNELCRTLAL